MSVLVQIADAVAASINGATFTEPLTAVRAYRPSYDLEQLAETRVTVVPRSMTIAALARLQSQVDCTVDVGIQQRVPSGDEARIGKGDACVRPRCVVARGLHQFYWRQRVRRELALDGRQKSSDLGNDRHAHYLF